MLTTAQLNARDVVRRTFSLVDAVPGLKHSGAYHMGACPFCGGRDRFQVKETQDGQLWICRHCASEKYSDALEFLARSGVGFNDALARYGGYIHTPTAAPVRGWGYAPAPLSPPKQTAEPTAAPVANNVPPCDEWQAAMWGIVATCADALQDEYRTGTAVAKWLMARGITAATAHGRGLGHCPHWQSVNVDGAAVNIAPGILIPCFDAGDLWYVKVRTTRAEQGRGLPKYLLAKGSNARALYGADNVGGAAVVLLVEGEFDAILGQEYAPQGTAVVTMGAASMTLETSPQWGNLLVSKGRRVFAAMDSDTAGQGAMAKWLEWPFVSPASPLPAGVKDVSELWQAEGGAAVAKWIGESVTNMR